MGSGNLFNGRSISLSQTKCPSVKSPDSLRRVIDRFLMHSFYSDVCLLYPPSQVPAHTLTLSHTQTDSNTHTGL